MSNKILIKCPVCRNVMHSHSESIEDKKVIISCERCQITLKEAIFKMKALEKDSKFAIVV